jgi:tetratricopeptide (TPR) repeat protein
MMEKQDEAVAAFKKAIKFQKDFADAYFGMGNSFALLGMFKDARDSYSESVRLNPADAQALFNLGFSHGMLGEYQKEIEAYNQALAVEGDYVNAQLGLGLAYVKMGDKVSAKKACDRLRELDVNLADALQKILDGMK